MISDSLVASKRLEPSIENSRTTAALTSSTARRASYTSRKKKRSTGSWRRRRSGSKIASDREREEQREVRRGRPRTASVEAAIPSP